MQQKLLSALLILLVCACPAFAEPVDTTATQTLTNKTLTSPIITTPTIDGTISGTAAILATGSTTARALTARFAEQINVKDYGAVCDNATDDTTAFTSAITAAIGKTLYVPPGTCIVSVLTVTNSMQFKGDGPLSVIKQKASTSNHIITISGTSVVVSVTDITLDGNKANQLSTSSNSSLRFLAIGTTSAPAALIVDRATFINGNNVDVEVLTDATRSTNEHVFVRGSRFLGGAEGQSLTHDPRYLMIQSPVNYIIADNLFDFLGTPSVHGRAGITVFDGHAGASTDRARGVVSDNFFYHVGRSEAGSTLGCIDLYNYGRAVSITGNTLVDIYGRGIDSKADVESLAIVGNVIDGLSGLGGVQPNAAIVVNSATNNISSGNVTIAGNTILDSDLDGIVYSGNNAISGPFARSVTINDNVIKNTFRRGISINNMDDAIISGNVIEIADIGILNNNIEESLVISGNRVTDTINSGIQVDSNSTTAWVSITGNHTRDTGGRGILVDSAAGGLIVGNVIVNATGNSIDTQDINGLFLVADNVVSGSLPYSKSGTNNGLRVERNLFSTNLSGSAREVTIAAGAVTVHLDWHTIDTEANAASDDLDTINGGFDGAMVTFRASDSARDVVFKDSTGNMKLNGNFTLNNVEDTITLRYMNGIWYEINRSDNGA
jgi:hypothetical protein